MTRHRPRPPARQTQTLTYVLTHTHTHTLPVMEAVEVYMKVYRDVCAVLCRSLGPQFFTYFVRKMCTKLLKHGNAVNTIQSV